MAHRFLFFPLMSIVGTHTVLSLIGIVGTHTITFFWVVGRIMGRKKRIGLGEKKRAIFLLNDSLVARKGERRNEEKERRERRKKKESLFGTSSTTKRSENGILFYHAGQSLLPQFKKRKKEAFARGEAVLDKIKNKNWRACMGKALTSNQWAFFFFFF